jgi:lambda repressor-like predicted transcriptional regulator
MTTIAIPRRSARTGRVVRTTLVDLSRARTFDWACLIALSTGALMLALVHPWSHAYIGEAQYGDAAYWDFAGENWARGYVAVKFPDIRAGYSVFLGMIYALTGSSFQFAFAGQAVLFAASVAMVFSIARMLRGRLAGVLAGALLALDPYLWEWVATSTTELLGAFANLVGMYFVVRACRPNGRVWDFVWFGLWIGIANVVRPVTLPIVMVGIAVVAVLWHVNWRRRALGGLLMVVGVAVGSLPGVGYQYATTGDVSLSSNSAANLFAASSPKYRTWTPVMYDDIAADLKTRGVAVTQESLNAEFTRLTIQNYLAYPGFQVQRLVDGLRDYGAFEGQIYRPERFVMFRPWLLALAAGIVLLGLALGRRVRWWWLAPGAVLIGALIFRPERTLAVIQVVGLGLPLWAVLHDRRSVGWVLMAAFWGTTGVFAILTTDVAGFFLYRLYTQVEPARAVLLALATVELSLLLVPSGRRAPILQLRGLFHLWRWRLPGASRLVGTAAAAGVTFVIVVGLLRLLVVNIAPPEAHPLVVPTPAELTLAANRLGLDSQVVYVGTPEFGPTRNALMSGKLPQDQTVYAIPGEFTRFVWYLDDQNRTLFWYVFSDASRPAALDKLLITAEVDGRLPVSDVANHQGLLFVAPTSAYFDRTGVVMLQNVLTVRGFAPLDTETRRFQLDKIQLFPLSWPLFDTAHFADAARVGAVIDEGPLQLATTGRMLRTLDVRTPRSSIRFSHVWVTPGAEFRADIALDPRSDRRPEIGKPRLTITVQDSPQAEVTLDPDRSVDFDFKPVRFDLGSYAGTYVDVTLTAVGPADADVLIGEPRLVTR